MATDRLARANLPSIKNVIQAAKRALRGKENGVISECTKRTLTVFLDDVSSVQSLESNTPDEVSIGFGFALV